MLNQYENLAEQLIREWLEKPWQITWIKEKKILGRCVYNDLELQFNKHWFAVLSDIEILDTIKHEIAHAYCFETGCNDNHGTNWRSAAKLIGAKPLACYNGIQSPPVRFIANCECGCEYKTGNKSTAYQRCSNCRKKLIYKDNYARIYN